MDFEKLLRRPNYRPEAVCRLLDISPSSVTRMVQKGEIAGTKVCGGLRINKASLIDYLRQTGLEVDPSRLEDRT